MPQPTRQQEINKSAGTIVDVPCMECKRSTRHRILASTDLDENWSDGRNSWQHTAHHQIVQCQGCETTSFRIAEWDSEDYDFTAPDDAPVERVVLYPSRSAGRNPLKDAHFLPSKVQRIYEETVKAMNNDQPVLAGIGIRALVETICKDKSAAGNNLSEKINGLVKIGVLTADGAEILHKIRTLGNDAAHEVEPHKADQLALALDVCEHLLQGVYLLPFFAKTTFK